MVGELIEELTGGLERRVVASMPEDLTWKTELPVKQDQYTSHSRSPLPRR